MDAYIGEIRMFAGNYNPEDWHLCDGSLLQISSNNVLYALLGTTYGGDGVTTFGLPNLQGRVVVGAGQGNPTNYAIGATGGTTQVSLVAANLPEHTHPLNASSANATTGDPTNNLLGVTNPQSGYPDVQLYADASQAGVSANATLDTNTVLPAGGTTPHANMQPYLVINYIICLAGLYPTPSN